MSDLDLVDKLNQNITSLNDICPSIFTKAKYDTTLGVAERNTTELTISQDEDKIAALQQAYFDKVEEGNKYIHELQTAEEDFFIEKYGSRIYNYLKEQRNNVGVIADGDDEDLTDLSYADLKQALEDEWALYQDLSNVDTSQLNSQDISQSDYAELDRRQIFYRNEVTSDVLNMSNYVTYGYYFIVIMFLLFLYSNNVLFLYKNKFLYAFIIIFPFIYRYVFNAIILLYNELYKFLHNSGPKNAFLKETEPFFFEDHEDHANCESG